jgi:hypothetical protein
MNDSEKSRRNAFPDAIEVTKVFTASQLELSLLESLFLLLIEITSNHPLFFVYGSSAVKLLLNLPVVNSYAPGSSFHNYR